MKQHSLNIVLAIFLIITLIVPPVFFVAQQKTYAADAVTEVGPQLYNTLKTSIETTISAAKLTLLTAYNLAEASAETALYVNTYVLQPLAFVMSGNLLKLITASVIDFVIGKTNGTGAPQFVQNLQGNLQTVGDTQALAFFAQFGRNSNSPFASAITSSLRTNYLQNTSSAGFWDANKCTLSASSPNIDDYLKGDWSQGGTDAWFALTTQDQNNPYTLYQRSQNQLASVVTSAMAARLAELNWGQGFLSWCSASETASNNDPLTPPPITPTPTLALGNNQFAPDNNGPKADGQSCSVSTDCTSNYCEGGICRRNLAREVGVNPGDPCYDKDGKPGTIKTPGSTIKATLDKVLGSTQDKLVQMGSVANEITGILGNIATTMATVNFAQQLLGGPNSGGLFGVGQPSGSNSTSQLYQHRNSPGYLGVTDSTVYQEAAALPMSGSDVLNRVSQYQSAWNTISVAANAASTSVTSLASFCLSQQAVASSTFANSNSLYLANFMNISNAEINAAQTALTTEIAPIFAQVANASTVSAVATAMAQKVQNELNSSTPNSGIGGSYTADLQALQSMPPTMQDIANAEQGTQTFGGATASPTGSLTVSGGSLVDQMNLISANATARKSVCTLN